MEIILFFFSIIGFGLSPFGDFHRRVANRNNQTPSSRLDSHRQQMALFDDFFSPMRMSLFDRDPFASHFAGPSLGTISSFNISYGYVFHAIKVS